MSSWLSAFPQRGVVGVALAGVVVAIAAAVVLQQDRSGQGDSRRIDTRGSPGSVAGELTVSRAAVEAPQPTPVEDSRRVAERVGVGDSASEMIAPWWYWIMKADCIAEATLAEVLPERYSTVDGSAPAHYIEGDRGWDTYIPLRFDVLNVIWCNESVDGFVSLQERYRGWQENPTPVPELQAIGREANWWVRPETLHDQPQGLAMVMFLPSGYFDSASPYDPMVYMWGFLEDLASSLSGPTTTYLPASSAGWYEYIDGEALDPLTGRRLPISDLLAEVQAGLVEAGKQN